MPKDLPTQSETAEQSRKLNFDMLGKNERKAITIAAANGRVTTSLLSENAEIGKRTASATLKRLREKGLPEWVGKNPYDPNQFYRLPENA